MSTTIDSLNFDFTASNVDIDGKVDAIVEMMGKIADSLGKISPSKLGKISEGMTTLATGLQSLTNVDASKLSSVADSISRMGDVQGVERVRKALDGTAKSAEKLGKTKVSADFFSKSNAQKTIDNIDKAYTSALEKFRDIGKDWKFDGSIESAQVLQKELLGVRNAILSAFKNEIRDKGVFDDRVITNYAKKTSEVINRMQVLSSYIQSAGDSAQKISEARISTPFERASEKAGEVARQAQSFVSLITGAFKDNAGSGKDWIPPESINERRKALVEMKLQLDAIGSELGKLSAQGSDADASKVQLLANAYQTLRNQISNIDLPTGSFDDLDAKLRSILASTNENPLLNGKLNPNIDWSTLDIGDVKMRSINEAAKEATLNFSEISKFKMPEISIGTRFSNEAQELIRNINKSEEAIARLKARVERMQAMDQMGSIGAKSLHFDYEKEVQNYNKMLAKFRELQAEGRVFERLRNALDGLDFEPVALRDGEKYTRGYARLVSHIENARKSLERLSEVQERMVHFGEDYGKAWEKNQYDIERTRAKMAEYIAQAQGMSSAGEATFSGNKAAASLEMIKSGAAKVGNAFDKVFAGMKKILSVTASIGVKGAKAFGRITTTIMGGTIKAVSKLGSALGAVSKKAAEIAGISNMFSHGNIFGKIEKGLRRVATLAIFMFLRTTIRSLMDAVRSGLDNIVQVSERANAALSSFATNVTYLKNSFAAMVTPILHAVYPVIEKLTNIIAFAANQMAAFFAAFTGQKTFTRAIRVQEDYAASLNKTSTAASKLHKQLAGFDDLNNLTTSQGNDAEVPSVQDMFEEVEVPDNIKNLADKIRDILKTDDWSKPGEMLADKLNKAMANIPWDKIEAEAQRIAKGIGTLINGFVEKLDWDLLGRTIARGINTALHFANTLLETINFHRIGEKLGVALKGLIDELDFDALGRFFANKYNWMIDMLHGFLKEMEDEWYHFGDRVGEAVDSFVRNLHLQEALENIALGLNAIADFVNGFVENWIDKSYEWGKKIGDAIVNMFNMIRWEDVGRAFDNVLRLIVTVWEGFLDAMEGEWGNIGQGIARMIERAFNPETFARLGTAIARTINGIIDSFRGLFGNRQMWENVGLSLGNFVNNIVNGIRWDAAVDTIVKFVNGFFIALDRFNHQLHWEELAYSLSKAINGLIHGIDWDAAGRTFGDFVYNLFSAITDIVKRVDWEGVGVAIGTFLGNIDWAKILGDVFEIIWTVLSGLLKGLLSTDGGRTAVLILALLAGLKMWLTKLLPAGLMLLFAHLSGAMGLGANSLAAAFSSAASGAFGSAFGSAAATAGAAGTQAFGSMFAGLGASVNGMAASAFGGFGAQLSALIGTPMGAMAVGVAAFTATVLMNLDNMKGRFQEFGTGVSGWIHYLVEGFDSPTRALVHLFIPALDDALDRFLDWKHQLIEKGLQEIPRTIKAAGEGLKNFGDLCVDLFEMAGTAINGFIEKHNIKEKIKNALDGAKDALKSFGEAWKEKFFDKGKEIGEKLKEAIESGNLKDAIGKFYDDAKEKYNSFFDNWKKKTYEKGKEIGESIRETFKNIKGLFDKNKIDPDKDYFDPFGNIKPRSASLIPAFEGVFAKFTEWKNQKLESMKTAGGEIISGLAKGISSGVKIVTTAAVTVGTGLLSTIKKLFKINSPSKVLEEIGLNLMQGLANGIVNAARFVVDAIGGIASGIFSGISTIASTAFDGLNTVLNGAWGAIKTGVESVLGGISDVASTAFGNVVNAVKGAWENVKIVTESVWNTVKTGLETAWNGIKSTAETVWTGIRTSLETAWSSITTAASTAFDGVVNAAKGAWENIKTVTETVWTGIKTVAENTWNGIKTSLETIWGGIATSARTVFNGVVDAAKTAWDGIRTITDTAWNGIKTAAETVWNGIKTSLVSIWGGIKDAASTLFSSVRDAINTAWESAQQVTSTVWEGIKNTLAAVWDGIKTSANTAFNGIKNGVEVAWNGIQSITSSVWNSISGALTSIWNTLSTSASSVFDGIRTIASSAFEAVKTVAQNIFAELSTAAQNALSKAIELVGNIASGIGGGIGNVTGAIQSVCESIGSWLSNAASNALNKGIEIVNNVANALQSGISTIQSVATNIAIAITNGLGNAIQGAAGVVNHIVETVVNGLSSAGKWGADMASNLAEGIRNGAGWVKDAVSGVADTIKGWLGHSVPREGALADELSWMPHMMQNLADGISSNIHLVEHNVGEIGNRIRSNLEGINAEIYGSNVTTSFSNGLNRNSNHIYDSIQALKRNVESVFNNVGYAVGNTGYNLINSFRSKVYDNMHYAVDAVKDMANNIKSVMKNVLEIHSPSRVFGRFAVYVVQGFNNGLIKMSGTTDKIIENWISNLTEVEANVDVKARITGLDELKPNFGAQIDLQRSVAMHNDVSFDGSEIRNLVHAIEMMSMQDQAAMRQQTEYLQQIARKEFSIGQRDVFSAVQNEAAEYEMRTGQPAFGY